jgi:small neutral amino acid transporter SnatA (MarC family)
MIFPYTAGRADVGRICDYFHHHSAENADWSWAHRVVLLACVALVDLASYIHLALGDSGAKWMGSLAKKIMTRLMGLLPAALAVQFLVNGPKGAQGLLARIIHECRREAFETEARRGFSQVRPT